MGAGSRMLQGKSGRNQYGITNEDADNLRKQMETKKNQSVISRLILLHNSLEAKNDKGNDWALARNLEDRIGSGQNSSEDVLKAESLLNKHQY